MKKSLLTLLFVFVASLFSQATTTIYKIEKDGKVLYVGGTIHLLRDKDYPLLAAYDSIYALADELVFETDIEKLEHPDNTQKILSVGMYSDDKTLKTVLSDKAYKMLEDEFNEIGLPLVSFNKFKPSMAILTLTMMKIQKMGVSATGVDKNYHVKAVSDHKKESHLESVEDQINMISTSGQGNESEFVISSIQDIKRMKRDFFSLISSWKTGDAKVMEKQLLEMKTDFPKVYKELLVDRNNKWMPQIEKHLTDDKIEFVLVGAFHLYGTDGLIQQLKNKGYTITQL